MIRYRHTLLLSLLFITIQNSCSDGTTKRCGEEPGVQTEIIRIKYGTSFGFCVGYCWKQLTINGDEIQFEKMSREEDEPVNCERDIDCSDWVPLSQNFDLENFFALEEVIGCPDCADGGAEWIEIQSNRSKHKVTFEYLSPPVTISAQVASLRELMKSFDACN
jgi:hypothetical protein